MLEKCSLEIELHHTKIWSFLRGELELSAYKLQLQQQINDKDKIERIDFAQYCRNDLGNDSFLLKRIVLFRSASFHSRKKWKSRTVGYGARSVHNKYTKLRTALLGYSLCRIVINNGPYLFEKKKYYGTELQMNASIRFASTALKLTERHVFSTEQYSPIITALLCGST